MWTKHVTGEPRARPVIGLTLALVLAADGAAVALRVSDRTPALPSPSSTMARPATPPRGTIGAPDAPEDSSPAPAATAFAVASATPPGGPGSIPAEGPAAGAVGAPGGAPASSPSARVADPTYRPPGGEVVRGPVPPPVGVYGLTARGSATATVGSGRCGGAPQSGAASTVSATAAGADPTFTLTDAVPLPGGSLRLTFGERYTEALTLTDVRRVDLSCGAAGHVSLRLAPALLAFPLNLATGERWTGRTRSAGISITSTSQVTGTERVPVGNASYGAYVVATTQTWMGTVHGTVRERWWVSPQLGVPLRMSLDDDLTGPRLAWSADLTLDVTSVPVKKATAGP